MSRYMPTPEQKASIDALTLAGYKVVRQGTYDNLLKRIDRAENNANWAKHLAEANREWARDAHAEERRLSRRLDEVCTTAAALGVSIYDINDALYAADKAATAAARVLTNRDELRAGMWVAVPDEHGVWKSYQVRGKQWNLAIPIRNVGWVPVPLPCVLLSEPPTTEETTPA